MKTFLSIQLHSNSPFLPICLPKTCGKTCRTWGGQTEEDISGTDAFSKKFQDGTIQNLAIINNTVCKEKLNSWVSRKAKRFILYFRLLLQALLMYNSYVANSYHQDVPIFSDHLCAKFVDDTRQCQEIDIGSPLFIKETDRSGDAR